MIRVEIVVSCDVPGCPRATKATAEFHGIVTVYSLDNSRLPQQRPDWCDVRFPDMPRETDPGRMSPIQMVPSRWKYACGQAWCPEHGEGKR